MNQSTDLTATREYLAEHLLKWEKYGNYWKAPKTESWAHLNWLGTWEGAGAVLEAMLIKGFVAIHESFAGYKAWFENADWDLWEGQSDNGPDAICLAAEAALRGGE